VPGGEMPTIGQMLADQVSPEKAERAILADSETAELY
jgi:hypothetical protein